MSCCAKQFRPALLLALFVSLAFSAAGADKPSTPKVRRDLAGTTALMGKFRSLFANWDLNKDGYLDKGELAKAFRGADAKPYEPATGSALSAKRVARKYPDHEFLIELDQDGDGKISRAEFMDWARSYVGELKKVNEGQDRIGHKEKQLKGDLPAAEKKKLTEELKQERKALADLRKQMRHLQTIEKHLQHVK
jgi:Ca2+-binding EF-hand superfamily protein